MSDVSPDGYAERIQAELAHYERVVDVHALPEIFHVWSDMILRPRLEAVGTPNIDHLWVEEFRRMAGRRTGPIEAVTLGAGDASVEISLARQVIESGIEGFRFTVVELNPMSVERGRAMARDHGLGDHFVFEEVDINTWKPDDTVDIYFANHSLHHFVELETIFDNVAATMAADGSFLVNDMIGRNGHMRWPEVEAVMQGLWSRLPSRYRYDHQLGTLDDRFVNWDCSSEGFEGIRAQDILPLLLDRFGVEVMVAFGNLAFPFIDRSFGHNFDPDDGWDRRFVEAIVKFDDDMIELGLFTPGQIVAVFRHPDGTENPRLSPNADPRTFVRHPDPTP